MTFPLAWDMRVTLRTITMFRISSERVKASGSSLCLLEIGRLQERDLHETREMAGFPFIDTGEGARIVAGDKDQAAPRPRPGQVEEKVRGDVDAVLLHDAHGPEAGKGGCRCDFQSHFFIGGPFHIEASLGRRSGKGFDDLGRRGAGIAGSNPHAGLQGAAAMASFPMSRTSVPSLSLSIDIRSSEPIIAIMMRRSLF